MSYFQNKILSLWRRLFLHWRFKYKYNLKDLLLPVGSTAVALIFLDFRLFNNRWIGYCNDSVAINGSAGQLTIGTNKFEPFVLSIDELNIKFGCTLWERSIGLVKLQLYCGQGKYTILTPSLNIHKFCYNSLNMSFSIPANITKLELTHSDFGYASLVKHYIRRNLVVDGFILPSRWFQKKYTIEQSVSDSLYFNISFLKYRPGISTVLKFRKLPQTSHVTLETLRKGITGSNLTFVPKVKSGVSRNYTLSVMHKISDMKGKLRSLKRNSRENSQEFTYDGQPFKLFMEQTLSWETAKRKCEMSGYQLVSDLPHHIEAVKRIYRVVILQKSNFGLGNALIYTERKKVYQ